MENVITCSNTACGLDFVVNTFPATQMPMMKEGIITCPHCLSKSAGAAGIIYISHDLPSDSAVTVRQSNGVSG